MSRKVIDYWGEAAGEQGFPPRGLVSAKRQIRAKVQIAVYDNFEKKKRLFSLLLFKAGELPSGGTKFTQVFSKLTKNSRN